MASSSRVSLNDCTVELVIPLPSALSAPPAAASARSPTPEETTLLAAECCPPERTEAYVGDTVFLVVKIAGPAGASCSADMLYQALDAFGDVQVFMGRDRASARSCSLPVLRESAWIGTSRALSGDVDGGSAGTPAAVLCKGVWALVRTPPENSQLADVMSVAGKQEIFVSLRERSVSHGLRNSPVWATIDRASRLFGKTIALTASKPLMVNLPIEISCHQFSVAECSDKAFVCVTARNATGDACLSIVPPYININSSKVVEDPDVNPHAGRPSRADWARSDMDGGGVESGEKEMTLDERYEFVPMFTSSESCEDEKSIGDTFSELTATIGRGRSTGGSASGEDYGLCIPSFNHWLRRAISLGPRESFNFVFKVVQKGSSQHSALADTLPMPTGGKPLGKRRSSSSVRRNALMLTPGTCLQTSVAVAWNCAQGKGAASLLAGRDRADALHREMSAGGVLATGKRGNVAVRHTSVYWRPAALLQGVVVTLSGPGVAALGARVSVCVGVRNQTGEELLAAVVRVRQDAGAGLLALRTVVVVGRVGDGGETTFQLSCIAIGAGRARLGRLQVFDRGLGEAGRVWTSEAEFEVFVVDRRTRVVGDPEVPKVGVMDEEGLAAG